MIFFPQTWPFQEMEITFSSHLLSIHSFNYFWLRLREVLSGEGLWSCCAAQEELNCAWHLRKDSVFSDLSHWQTGEREMVRVAGSLLDWDPWSHMLLCWAAGPAGPDISPCPAAILLHPGSHCAPLFHGTSWFYSGLPLSHSLACRKQLSLLVGLRGCNGPEMTEAWEGGGRVERSCGDVLGLPQATLKMSSETMWFKLFGAP